MVEKFTKYKKYILSIVSLIMLSTLFFGINHLMKSKNNEPLPEEKLREIDKINRKQFAMYIEDGESYKEYTDSDKFPIGYVLNIGKSKCEDISGNNLDVNNILSSNGNSVTVKSNKTVYCTLYFDYVGDGSKERPYKIQYIEDLVDLSNSVDNGETYAGKYFELTRDLDFKEEGSYRNYKTKEYGDINGNSTDEELKTELTTGTGWKPIGNYTHYFNGNFDGGNHTLENLYIHIYTNNNHPELTVGSLFGFITDGEIKNLTITGDLTTDEKANIGGLASYASNVSIKNVHNYANITSHGDGYSTGGIIGSIGNINVGLTGDNVRITSCSNHGTIQGGNHGGGLIGYLVSNAHLYINDSYNAGNVMNSIITNAGIIAENDGNCYINNSYNIGHIFNKGGPQGGGLMAAIYGTTFILNSYNSGTVEYTDSISAENSIAGLLGKSMGKGYILNSYNVGAIKGDSNDYYVGGIVNASRNSSLVYTLQIYNTYNAGTISGGSVQNQIAYQYNGVYQDCGIFQDVYYKSNMGVPASNISGAIEISDANMRLNANDSNSLAYKLNEGRNNINLDDIEKELINLGYNNNYFELTLNPWFVDAETGYPNVIK